MKETDIIEAWSKIRKVDQTIPDEVLDFMKDAAVQKLKVYGNKNLKWLKSSQEIKKGNIGDFVLEFPFDEEVRMTIILRDHEVTNIIPLPINGGDGVIERIEFKNRITGEVVYEEKSHCRKIIVQELYA